MIQTIAITRDLATCLAIRRTVFIEEQGVSEADEVDGLDPVALHLLAMQDAAPVGTARLLVEGRRRQDRAGLRAARGARAPGLVRR